MTDQSLTPEQEGIVRKVEGLLRLAARNSSPEEAASAAAKAQELLAAYNLESVEVSPDTDRSAAREKLKIRGGMYRYQREMWDAVARLNFCVHFTVAHEVERKYGGRPTYWGKEFRHTLVGRIVNTRSTRAMAEYLERTIERLTQERYPANTQRFSREATAFREGVADHVVLRLHERRRTAEADEARRRADAARSDTGTSQALTLAAHSASERDANMDVVMGEGWSACQRAQRQADAERRRLANEAYTQWAAAHPDEVRREAEKARRDQAQRDRRGAGRSRRAAAPDARERRQWTSQYAQGWDRGASVGIDPQAEGAHRGQGRLE